MIHDSSSSSRNQLVATKQTKKEKKRKGWKDSLSVRGAERKSELYPSGWQAVESSPGSSAMLVGLKLRDLPRPV